MNLIDYFLSNIDRNMIHKPMSYFEIYERHFAKFKNKKVKILEIGVENGGSVAMWKYYLGKKAEVIGIDIDIRCKRFEEEGIRIYIGDQSDEMFLRSVVEAEDYFDIIVDDGGHVMNQQITSFNILYEAVSNDGVYLCEDTGTSYMAGYNGGLKREGTFIEMAKSKVDELYAFESYQVAETYFAQNTHGIHFYENIVVFEKRVHKMNDTRAIGKFSI